MKRKGKGIVAIRVGVRRRIRRSMKVRTGSSCTGPVRRARISPIVLIVTMSQIWGKEVNGALMSMIEGGCD